MISRRNTLKTIAAAFMAPTIQLRQSVSDERLMMAFCEPDRGRYRLQYEFEKPFGFGSLTYASDYKALIRCELAGRIEDGEKRLPPIAETWDRYWMPQTQWRPLTPDDLRPTEACDGNFGFCPECGDRRVSAEYPKDAAEAASLPDWDVDDNTIRDVSCPRCHGRWYGGPSNVRICGVLHSSWNLRRIVALPNPQVCKSLWLDPKSDANVILFRADGFEGMSMGMAE